LYSFPKRANLANRPKLPYMKIISSGMIERKSTKNQDFKYSLLRVYLILNLELELR
jgi:hypothetical protein